MLTKKNSIYTKTEKTFALGNGTHIQTKKTSCVYKRNTPTYNNISNAVRNKTTHEHIHLHPKKENTVNMKTYSCIQKKHAYEKKSTCIRK